MKDTDKVTMTIGQLKKLVTESQRRITLWYVFTGDLDGVDKTCQSLYNIVNACKEDNSNYQKQHRKTVEWLGKYVGAEFGPKEAFNVARHFVGLSVDPNDWPPCLMFDNRKAADTVACTLAQGTNLWPEDLYGEQTEWDEVEESAEELTESGDGKWYVQCDPTFFHENHCQTQKKIFDFMKKFDWDIPESAYGDLVNLAKSLGADGCIGFTENEDSTSWFLVFNDEEDALNWANILYDDGTSWPEDYVTDWL